MARCRVVGHEHRAPYAARVMRDHLVVPLADAVLRKNLWILDRIEWRLVAIASHIVGP